MGSLGIEGKIRVEWVLVLAIGYCTVTDRQAKHVMVGEHRSLTGPRVAFTFIFHEHIKSTISGLLMDLGS